jgi:glutamine synthetase
MAALGEHIAGRFIDAKRTEWGEYISRVSEWEIEKYLGLY